MLRRDGIAHRETERLAALVYNLVRLPQEAHFPADESELVEEAGVAVENPYRHHRHSGFPDELNHGHGPLAVAYARFAVRAAVGHVNQGPRAKVQVGNGPGGEEPQGMPVPHVLHCRTHSANAYRSGRDAFFASGSDVYEIVFKNLQSLKYLVHQHLVVGP